MSSVFNHRRAALLLLSSDSFVAPDATPLTTTDGQGQEDPLAWTVQEGNINEIISDRAACSGPAAGKHITSIDPGANDAAIECNSVSCPAISAISAGVVFRWTDDSNYLFAALFADGSVQMFKVVAGTPTQLGSTVTGTPGVPIDMTVIARGASLLVQRNSVTIITATDAFNDTATVCGLYANDLTSVSPTSFSWGPFSVSLQ